MEPITVPDLSARPLGFKVERLMESPADASTKRGLKISIHGLPHPER
ncbi:hypothetical protein [Mesobacillus boroniphilus]